MINSLPKSMSALCMQGTASSLMGSQIQNGASSFDSSSIDSSTRGRITSVPLLPNGSNQPSGFSQSKSQSQAFYTTAPSTDFVGNMDHPLDNSFRQISSTNFNGDQQRYYNGGQQKGNNSFKQLQTE